MAQISSPHLPVYKPSGGALPGTELLESLQRISEESLDLVPLARAVLCLDCERISASRAACAGCGSQALLPLARALGDRQAAPASTPARSLARRLLLQHSAKGSSNAGD